MLELSDIPLPWNQSRKASKTSGLEELCHGSPVGGVGYSSSTLQGTKKGIILRRRLPGAGCLAHQNDHPGTCLMQNFLHMFAVYPPVNIRFLFWSPGGPS